MSASPDSRLSISRRFASSASARSAARPSAAIAASPSASASAISSSVSATSASSLLHALDLPRRAGCARASASARRRRRSTAPGPRRGGSVRRGGLAAASQSKMPPQQRDGLLDLFVAGRRIRRTCRSIPANAHVGKGRAQYSPPRLLSTPPTAPPARRGGRRRAVGGWLRWQRPCRSAPDAPGTWSGLNASVTMPRAGVPLRHGHARRLREVQHRPVLQRHRHVVVPDRRRRRPRRSRCCPARPGCRSRPTPRSPGRA